MGENFLPSGTFGGIEPELVIMAISGLCAVFVVLAVWSGLVVRDPFAARAKALAKHRADLRAGVTRAQSHNTRAKNAVQMMRGITAKLNLVKAEQAERMSMSLMRAGWRTKDALVIYLFAKIALPAGAMLISVALFYGLNLYDLSALLQAAACLGATLFGSYLPEVFVRNAVQRRQSELQKALPDALDLLVICAEAGLALDAGLNRVAREMGQASPALADEFGLTAAELGFLPDRTRALENLANRTDLASIRGVVNTLMQTEKFGTPLAQSLRVLAGEFRNERLMKAEEKAARLPTILTVPMILFILPCLFVILLGPAILRLMDNLPNM
ncbi:MAG: type II secretion system F family protein [Magnetovibrionaceae bacterium]